MEQDFTIWRNQIDVYKGQMCTPQAAEKLIAMDYDNLAIQETTIVG